MPVTPSTQSSVSELLISCPDFRVFWSSYDPLDLVSDSIDPLGFMAGYIALADRILPGLTTITTVPRYTGMLCLALKLAQEAVGEAAEMSPSKRRSLLVEKLKLCERCWALACGLAAEDPAVGPQAITGLRGIRAVQGWQKRHAQKERITLAFDLLSNQVRYGGIGAYSTLLETLRLADMNTLTLLPLGRELADAFPSPGELGANWLRPDMPLPVAALANWGRHAHAGSLTPQEARLLRCALQGGEEAEEDDHTRWTMLRLIRNCDTPEPQDESRLLAVCLASLQQTGASGNTPSAQASSRIQNALCLIEPFERMYQCAAFIFDQIRCHAAAAGHIQLHTVMEKPALRAACVQLGQAAARFLTLLDTSMGYGNLGPAPQVLRKLGLVACAQTWSSLTSPLDLGQEVLQRHLRVQAGKFDGGQPKGPWVRLEPGPPCSARLTAQRFGLELSQTPATWHAVTRHPYRTVGARRFIQLCKIS